MAAMYLVHVAVGVILNKKGKVLIAKRSSQAHQGGLWEFPGGKLDADESVSQALTRELREELAIEVISTEPLINIRHDYSDKSVLLHVHTITHFTGDACGNEGQPICWVSPNELHLFEFPAANRPIITAITLPQRILITGSAASDGEYLLRAELALKAGIRCVQLRKQDSLSTSFFTLAEKLSLLCNEYSAKLMLNTSVQQFLAFTDSRENFGLHLNAYQAMSCLSRPVSQSILLGVSCHNVNEIAQAERIGADYICLSPVKETSSHLDQKGMGWENFAQIVATVTVPVFALGGMQEKDLPQAKMAGAQGIAGISAWWNLL